MRTHPMSEIKNGLEVRGVRVSLIQTAHCVTRLMSLARILAPQRGILASGSISAWI